MAVQIPPTADKLRRIINLAQIVQSHALSFFYLSSPDLLLGMDADPADAQHLRRDAKRIPRSRATASACASSASRSSSGSAASASTRPGSFPAASASRSTDGSRDASSRRFPKRWPSPSARCDCSSRDRRALPRRDRDVRELSPPCSWAWWTTTAASNIYDGSLRFVDAGGDVVADGLDPHDYHEYIGETVEPWSYLKSAYYKPLGYPDGMYRVGPLARLNVADGVGTPARRPGSGPSSASSAAAPCSAPSTTTTPA